MPQQALASLKSDRRSRRSQCALRDALAALINEGEDLTRITVAALTDRAGLTRRTFYSHYKDIPEFVEQVEAVLLADILELIHAIAATNLPQVYTAIEAVEPAPGSVELLRYFAANRDIMGALLGAGGDPAFIGKIIQMVKAEIAGRMQEGIFPAALGSFFDYYVSYVVAAMAGVVQRWFEGGLAESPQTMACIMTMIAFVRPGDLYGMPIDINVPAYGLKLMTLNLTSEEE